MVGEESGLPTLSHPPLPGDTCHESSTTPSGAPSGSEDVFILPQLALDGSQDVNPRGINNDVELGAEARLDLRR